MEDLFGAALGIESPWYISDVAFDEACKRLDIHLDFKRGSRFELDGEMCGVHDTVRKEWRHLNFFEHECYLHARVPRVKGPDGRVKLILPPWASKLDGFTLLFEAMCVEFCKHMPVSQVGRLTNVSDYKLWRMLDLYVMQARSQEDYSDITTVGVDETSLAKHHQYITLFVDLAAKRTLFATPGKGAETVNAFADELAQHQAHADQITQVSCDMSPAFIKGVGTHLPNASMTFDRFHVVKILNEAVDQVRREEAKANPLLKGKRYLFLKNKNNLSQKQQQMLDALQMEDLNLNTMKAL
jgi:transposase